MISIRSRTSFSQSVAQLLHFQTCIVMALTRSSKSIAFNLAGRLIFFASSKTDANIGTDFFIGRPNALFCTENRRTTLLKACIIALSTFLKAVCQDDAFVFSVTLELQAFAEISVAVVILLGLFGIFFLGALVFLGELASSERTFHRADCKSQKKDTKR